MASTKTVVIANGQTTSGAVGNTGARRGYKRIGVALPATFTGASISFSVSADGTTYQALYAITATLVSVTVVQGRSYDLPEELQPWPFFKIVSASAEGAERTLKVVMAE